jgi:hypothetical protein
VAADGESTVAGKFDPSDRTDPTDLSDLSDQDLTHAPRRIYTLGGTCENVRAQGTPSSFDLPRSTHGGSMTLHEVPLTIARTALPEEVRHLLREADARANQFLRAHAAQAIGFVQSDYTTVYAALQAILGSPGSTCRSFCEWGSGLGVVSCLASMLELSAYGIEIDRRLVDLATELAHDFGLAAEFIHGSFIPPKGEAIAEQVYAHDVGEMFWLETSVDNAYDELGLDVDDFDLIFVYPWPGEQHVVEQLFDRFAAQGALLLLYDQFDSVRLLRKVARSASR